MTHDDTSQPTENIHLENINIWYTSTVNYKHILALKKINYSVCLKKRSEAKKLLENSHGNDMVHYISVINHHRWFFSWNGALNRFSIFF